MKEDFKKYKDLFDTMDTGIVFQDEKGKIIEANAAAVRILGYSKEQLYILNSRSKIWKTIKYDGSPFPLDEYPSNISLKTGKKVNDKVMGIYNPKLGEYRWINVNAIPEFRNGEKKPYQAIVSFCDITEQKKLNDQFFQFKKAVDFSSNAIRMYTPEGNCFYQNKAFDVLFGYIDCKNPYAIYVDEKAGHKIFRTIKSGNSWNGNVEMYGKDKSILTVRLRAYSIKDNKGKIIGLVGVYNDITMQNQAERELRESEQRYKALIEDQTELISRYLPDTTLTFVNDAYCRFFGKSREEFIGKSYMHMIAPEFREQVRKETLTLAKNKGSVIGEYINYRYDGKECWIQWSVKCITNDVGKVVELQAVGRDLTERKNAEKALQESEKKFRSMIEHSSEAITLLNHKGEVLYESPSVKWLTGYSTEERMGKNAFNNVFIEDREKAKKLIKELVLKEDNSISTTFRAVRKDGTIWWAEGTATNRLNDPNINAIIINYRDISLQKEAEDRLKLTQYGIDHSQIAVYQLDDLGRIYYANEQACKSLGYSKEEILKLKISDFDSNLSMVNWEENRKMIEQLGSFTVETVHKRKDGTTFPVEVTINIIEFEGKKHNFSFVRDMTEKKKAEDALKIQFQEYLELNKQYKKQNKELKQTLKRVNKINDELIEAKLKAEESDRLKTAFLANMSHEIRTPMNGILGFTELLKDPELTEDEKSKYLEIIQKSGDRMLNIINDLIDISKIEAGQVEVTLTPTSINKMFDSLYEFFLPEAEKRNLTLIFKKELTDTRSVIETDEVKLNQILSNLIKNALKFTPSGQIELGYSVKSSSIVFYVQDTGIGISQEFHKKIFERFLQGEHYSEITSEGSGLGLSISKAFLEKMGGNIWVKSEPGKGSVFYISLPYKQIDSTPKHESSKIKHLDRVLSDFVILIAEDDDTSYEYLEKILIPG